MSEAPFKPAGAAFAALVAGLAGAQAEAGVEAADPHSLAETQAARELEAALASLPALGVLSEPDAAPAPDPDVPLAGQGELPF